MTAKSCAQMRTTYVASVDMTCMSYGVGNTLCTCERSLKFCNESSRAYEPGEVTPDFFQLPAVWSFHATMYTCTSNQKRQECCKPHHTLLHWEFEGVAKSVGQDSKQSMSAKADDFSASHSSSLSCLNSAGQSSPLMMTCQIAVVTSDGCIMRAVVLLNCALSTLFVTDHLAWWLQWPHQRQHVQVAGIGGLEHTLSLCYVLTFIVANQKSVNAGRLSGPPWMYMYRLQAFWNYHQIPALHVSFDADWRHLLGHCLAALKFGVPGSIEVHVHPNVDMCSCVVNQGQRQGPPCFPWL